MKRLTIAACAVALVIACAHGEGGWSHHRYPGEPPEHQTQPAEATTPEPVPDGGWPKSEAVLTHQPKIPNPKPFEAPVPTVVTLANGLKLYLVQRQGEPLEAVEVVLRAGAITDPPSLPGLASMSAAMLPTGAAGMSQLEMARAVEALGASLSSEAGEDALWVSISGLSTQAEPMTKLLANVVLRPTLSTAQWNKLKSRREAELLDRLASPEVAAILAWKRAVYGDNPLAHPVMGTTESVKAMQLSDVKRFVQRLSPTETAVVAVGGVRVDRMKDLLTDAFGDWQPVPGARPLKPSGRLDVVPQNPPRFVAVEFPGKVQSVLRVGQPGVPRASPNALALRVMNEVLGGSFTSRLMQDLREKHGYTYGAGSALDLGEGPGPFLAYSSVKTSVTGDALGQMMKELNGITEKPISDAELKKGRALLTFDLVRNLQLASDAADELAEIYLYNLPLDEYQTFVPRLNELTVDRVHVATSDLLHPDRMTIAVAGDMAKVLPQIRKNAALKLPAPVWYAPSGLPLPKGKAPHFGGAPTPGAPDGGTASMLDGGTPSGADGGT